jgi:hypothetical protein
MFPFRTSSIFRSRWIALLWAAGMLWTAYDVADSNREEDATNAAVPTDPADATITQQQVDDLKKKLESL